MSKFSSAADAAKYLGLLVVTPKHGVVVLHAVKRGDILEAPEGFHSKLVECEPVESLSSEPGNIISQLDAYNRGHEDPEVDSLEPNSEPGAESEFENL